MELPLLCQLHVAMVRGQPSSHDGTAEAYGRRTLQMQLTHNVCNVRGCRLKHVRQQTGYLKSVVNRNMNSNDRQLFGFKLTLNDLCGGTARSVAFEGCISIARLLQQVTQLLTGLQLVFLQQCTPQLRIQE